MSTPPPQRWLSFYHPSTRAIISAWQSKLGLERRPGETVENEQQHLPIELYDEIVIELRTNSGALWDMWNGSNSADASGSDFSRARSRVSEISLSRIVDNTDAPAIQPVLQQVNVQRTNLSNLQKAWDVSQRATREDWDEWMRRLSVQLLREAPSPALRACAELAQAYQPLAHELFSAAFVCCWGELNDQYRSNLIFSMEVVFSADASLEILQVCGVTFSCVSFVLLTIPVYSTHQFTNTKLLLNLAEFMEQDSSIIPSLAIDVSVLAELALKCRAYARALHYKEREYRMEGRGGSCVEQLIDINKKLDLPEAALGVLKAAKIEIERRGGRSFVSAHNQQSESHFDKNPMAYSVIGPVGDHGSWAGDIMYESWLAKLGSWVEALAMYEEKLRDNPNDVDTILGCMQCYDARGSWQNTLHLAERSWAALSGDISSEPDATSWHQRPRKESSADTYKQALKFCAQAAWRLGEWDLLDTYSSQLVQGQHGHLQSQSAGNITALTEPRANNSPEIDFDGAFYRAVLNINRAQWDEAATSIDAARKAMDSRFTALLAESYKRAYPSMVSAMLLSELEEIVTFRRAEMQQNSGIKLHAPNRYDKKQERQKQHLIDVWRKRLDGCRVDAEVHSSILAVRSLVLGPTDEVDATITLSALSRQDKAYQLAERTLLDPLAKMGCSLNSHVFGVGLPANLSLGLPEQMALDNIVDENLGVQMNYNAEHEQFGQQLFDEAGGEERLVSLLVSSVWLHMIHYTHHLYTVHPA